jgi:chromosome segregation ATPase
MRDLKHDPFRAYQTLRPIVDQLEQIVGVRLPADLQSAVNLGQITEPHARELATARGRTTVTTQQLERRDQQDQAQKQQNEFQGRVDEVETKVNEWESSKRKTDPDWKHKQPRVKELNELEFLRRQRTNPKYFPTPTEAIEISKASLEKVEREFRSMAPARREIKPEHADGSATRSTPKPKTATEAAKLALAATG